MPPLYVEMNELTGKKPDHFPAQLRNTTTHFFCSHVFFGTALYLAAGTYN